MTSISWLKEDAKRSSAIQEISLPLFLGAYDCAEMELSDQTGWVSEHMVGTDKEIFRECLTVNVYSAVHGIRMCALSRQARDQIAREVIVHFLNWLLTQNEYTGSDRDTEQCNLLERFRRYDRMLNAFVKDQAFLASQIAFQTMQGVLKPGLDREDVFDTIKMFSVFANSVLAYSNHVSRSLNNLKNTT